MTAVEYDLDVSGGLMDVSTVNCGISSNCIVHLYYCDLLKMLQGGTLNG